MYIVSKTEITAVRKRLVQPAANKRGKTYLVTLLWAAGGTVVKWPST